MPPPADLLPPRVMFTAGAGAHQGTHGSNLNRLFDFPE